MHRRRLRRQARPPQLPLQPLPSLLQRDRLVQTPRNPAHMNMPRLQYPKHQLPQKFIDRLCEISLILCTNQIILYLQSIFDSHKIVSVSFGHTYEIMRQSYFIFTSIFPNATRCFLNIFPYPSPKFWGRHWFNNFLPIESVHFCTNFKL
jgi:hypothetical protein